MLRVTTLLIGLSLALLLVGCTIQPVVPEGATPAATEAAQEEATPAPSEEATPAPAEEATPAPAEEPSPFTAEILESVSYSLEVVGPDSFQLTDGVYEDPANHIAVNWVDTYALGDLNGAPSAAVVLLANTGGSGTFSNLAIVQMQDDQPVQVASTLLGDRTTMNWLAVANDEIQIDMVIQGPDEPMCCATQRTLVSYALESNNQLTNTATTAIGVQPQITSTLVITYVPSMIPTTTQKGSCFANAIGLGRADAWRCTTEDNAIYDPCFAVDATPTLVCGADPITGEEGFVLELTEALPTPDPGTATGPWIVQLGDGTICTLSTGTIPGVGDQTAPYACADEAHSNLMQEFTVFGTYWYAQNVVFGLGDNGFWIESSVLTPVAAVWH